ncbi:hypothetical protein ARMGADRAFT_1071401 [Armillaria gallica]|uniref:CCHC-type domain-containing protein n=1 Tax=Armillaria gallica TaxID=47427 RepID=A0A2H3EQ50_ARMGA|nr:hypothetical protein ARMGADRAFT_1071401 [Armillaria gallica]
MAGADSNEQMQTGQAQGGGGAGEPTLQEQYEAAIAQVTQLRDTQEDLCDQLAAAHRAPPLRPGPDLGRFSIQQLPNWMGPPAIGPSSAWNLLNPPAAAGVKPILMEKPGKFSGKHDDIEHFLGDCTAYFEVFWQYFMDVPSRTIVLLTSLLEEDVQDWWVHRRPDFWHYPNWDNLIWEFCDAAIKETHEKKMGEIKMYGKTVTKFFREIKREAKLVNRRDDTGPQETMDYDEWKERVCTMYKQREIQKAYEQVHRIDNCHDNQKPNQGQKQITAPSNQNHAGGMSSSSTVAVKGKTYGGAGEPMQIDQKKYMSEGWCFNCNERGHILKNCPKLKKQQVQAVEVIEEPKPEMMKMEEVKE